MKYLFYAVIGFFFGVVMYKSEAASWFRIFEMFQFKAFHMYGIIGSAVVLGAIGIQAIKRFKLKAFDGTPINLPPKERRLYSYLFGGALFGLGWGLAGACPGPMFVLVGAGFPSLLIVILGALLGTFIYGLLKNKLPH